MSARTVLVTGAARGIGRATAALFAARGWQVAAFDRDEAGLADLPAAVRGGLDVTDPDGWTAALAQVEAATGRLDVLVNNAGILVSGPVAEVPLAAQAAVVDVNVKGVLYGCAAALPLLRRTPGAVVVNLSSASAFYGQPGLAAYAASKAAVSSLTEALDLEWAGLGVRVVDVQPLYVRGHMVDSMGATASVRSLGVRLAPEDVAAAVLSAATTVPGGLHRPVGRQARVLGLGSRLLPPAAVRRLVARQSG